MLFGFDQQLQQDVSTTDGLTILLCDDVILDVDVSDVICKADYEGIDIELQKLIKWQTVIDEVNRNDDKLSG